LPAAGEQQPADFAGEGRVQPDVVLLGRAVGSVVGEGCDHRDDRVVIVAGRARKLQSLPIVICEHLRVVVRAAESLDPLCGPTMLFRP